MFDVALAWLRYPDGVQVVDLGPVEADDRPAPKTGVEAVARALMDGPREPAGIGFAPRTARVDPYRVEKVDLERPAILSFINADTPERLAAFYAVSGPLHGKGMESLELAGMYREGFSRLLEIAFKDEDAGKADVLNNNLFRHLRLRPEFDYGNGSAKGRVVLYASSLFDFMAAETAVAVMSGVKLVRCENCGDAFFTGAAAGRRVDARTCSNRCRMALSRKGKLH